MYVKDGHMCGMRPAAKIPYGLEEQYEAVLDDLYDDLVPVNDHELITASQVVPVCEVPKW